MHWPRWTVRARLTVWYGLAFFVAAVAVVLVIYLPVADRLDTGSGTLTTGTLGESTSAGGVDHILPTQIEAIAAEQRSFKERAMRSLLVQSLSAVGVAGLVAIGVGWLMAGRALRPLHDITAAARRVAERSLHERIALSGPRDELKDLADTFDAMLERLDRAFDGQSRFVANASHELRTPLAINRALVEYASTDPAATPELRQLGAMLLANNARHERLIDGLLFLARSESEVPQSMRVDLAEIAAHVVEQLTEYARAAGVELHWDLSPTQTCGDPILLERLVANLVDNAARHNAADGLVHITTRTTAAGAEFSVANSGPLVASFEIPDLFEPFRRAGELRTNSTNGAGLGLSIVRSITLAHHGTIDAQPREGGGLVVRVVLRSCE